MDLALFIAILDLVVGLGAIGLVLRVETRIQAQQTNSLTLVQRIGHGIVADDTEERK